MNLANNDMWMSRSKQGKNIENTMLRNLFWFGQSHISNSNECSWHKIWVSILWVRGGKNENVFMKRFKYFFVRVDISIKIQMFENHISNLGICSVTNPPTDPAQFAFLTLFNSRIRRRISLIEQGPCSDLIACAIKKKC
jgi:hypothetical protein